MGPFTSWFEGKDAPDLGEDALGGGLIERSPESARLVVIGSASFLADPVVELARTAGDGYLTGLQLATNLVDWSLEDVELLRIRSRGGALEPTSVATRQLLEWGNYGFAVASVVIIGLVGLRRRRDAVPMELDPPAQARQQQKGAA